MYKVYAEKYSGASVLIYMNGNLSDDTKALSPKLTLTENNAGEFSIKLPSTNAGYDFVERLNTIIIVKKDEEEIWRGRIISMKEDFQKNKTITCEGEFAYLNDTIQPQEEYLNRSLNYILTSIINHHNTKDSGYGGHKQFSLGYITATDMFRTIDTYTNYESTLKVLNDKFIEPYGGIFRLRRSNNTRYLDYISESLRPISSQVIEFGSNLLDFTKSYDGTDFCTVIIPLGARVNDEYAIESGDIDKIQAYTTIESVNSGSPYLANGEAINNFGWIEKAVHFDDVEDPEELLEKAQEYLKDVVFENLVLEVNAVDLGYLGADYQNINLSEKVRVISKPHNLDSFFPVKKITIPLDNPANTSFTMGDTVKTTLSAKTATDNVSLNDKINGLPTETHTLALARKNASDLIDSFTTGYITIIRNNNGSQELYVTDAQIKDTYEQGEDSAEWIASRCDRYWRWNLEGLAYYNKSRKTPLNPKGIGTAITMDGAIVADYLTVGTIRGGGINPNDGLPNSYWNLNTGEFRLSSSTKIGAADKYGNTTTLESMSGQITANAAGITAEYTRSSAAEGALSGKIEANAAGVKLEFSKLNKELSSDGTYYHLYEGNFGFTAERFNSKFYEAVYGQDTKPIGVKDNLKEEWTSNFEQTARDLRINFNKKVYGQEVDDDKLIDKTDGKSIVEYASNMSLDAEEFTLEFNKRAYGQDKKPDALKDDTLYSKITVTANSLSSVVSTVDEHTSSITQMKENIIAKVSKGDVTSMLSLGSGITKITTPKLVITSGNFILTEEGVVTVNSANLTNCTIWNKSGKSWMYITGTQIHGGYGSNPGKSSDITGTINLANLIGGNRNFLQLNSHGVVFSCDQIGVTGVKNGTDVSFGVTDVAVPGDEISFVDGICIGIEHNG